MTSRRQRPRHLSLRKLHHPVGRFPSAGSSGVSSPTSSVPISRLRLLASPRASLRLLRSALPPLRPPPLPRGRTLPRGPGPFLSRRPRRLSSVEKTRHPRFLDDPCVHAPLFDPGGPPAPGHFRTGDVVFRWINGVDSATMLSRLHHAACTLSVYASQPGSPPDHATLDSGWWPTLSGQDSHLLGHIEGFRHVFPFTCPSLGRALARAPVGGGFPAPPFRLRGGFTVPP